MPPAACGDGAVGLGRTAPWDSAGRRRGTRQDGAVGLQRTAWREGKQRRRGGRQQQEKGGALAPRLNKAGGRRRGERADARASLREQGPRAIGDRTPATRLAVAVLARA
jgi:hypothetical protein